MNIRLFNDSDHKKLCSWWKDHNWSVIPLPFLPKIGIIVDECAAGFIYSTDSKICLLEFVVVDPKSEKDRRRLALDALIKEASKIAKELGYNAIFSSVSHPGLIQRFKSHGFNVTDESMTNLIKVV